MTCNEYSVLLEKLLEGSLTDEEALALRRHEAGCPACARQHRELDHLQDTLSTLDSRVSPMPEDLHAGWMQKVEEEAMEKKRRFTTPGRRAAITRALSVAAALVFVLGGTLLTRDALNSAPQAAAPKAAAYDGGDYDSAPGAGYAMQRSYTYTADTSSLDTAYAGEAALTAENGDPAIQEKKIIRTASLSITTSAFDDSLATLRSLCETSGGWVAYASESSGSTRRTASLTLRIPAAQLDAFLEGAGGAGRVTRREESADDVTESYYDTKARLETQQALMARLQVLVTDAADLSDLLALESQIADTQYQIDSLQARLNSTDRQVDYATVNVSLKEELPSDSITDVEMTLGQRIGHALTTGWEIFTSFLGDTAVFLVAALPFLALLAMAWIIIRLVRRSRRHKG